MPENELFVPIEKLIGRFTFVAAPNFVKMQEEFFAAVQKELMSQARAGKIDRPHLEIKAHAKELGSTLVIDVSNEELLFNITAEDITFSLGKGADFKLAATYMESFLLASEEVFKVRDFVAFEVRSIQIVRVDKSHNSFLMAQLLTGLTDGKNLFKHMPGSQSSAAYRVQRTDISWTVLVDDLEYLFDIQAPANEEWRTLHFNFTVRSPEDEMASVSCLEDIGGVLNLVKRGQPFLKALNGVAH